MKFNDMATQILKICPRSFARPGILMTWQASMLASWLVRTVVWTYVAHCPDPYIRDNLWTTLVVEELAKILACDLKLHGDFEMEVLRAEGFGQGAT